MILQKVKFPIKDKFDLGWSVEFVKHVYEEYQTKLYARCFSVSMLL